MIMFIKQLFSKQNTAQNILPSTFLLIFLRKKKVAQKVRGSTIPSRAHKGILGISLTSVVEMRVAVAWMKNRYDL